MAHVDRSVSYLFCSRSFPCLSCPPGRRRYVEVMVIHCACTKRQSSSFDFSYSCFPDILILAGTSLLASFNPHKRCSVIQQGCCRTCDTSKDKLEGTVLPEDRVEEVHV